MLQVVEMAEQKDVAGRRRIKVIFHEIYPDPSQYNENGISWNEENTKKNMNSAIGMPLVAEFLDQYDRSEPYGHGLSGFKDGRPIFDFSDVVGTIYKVYIDDVEVNGKTIRAFLGEGYLYEQRYPYFVDWIKAKMFDGDNPKSSIEISAKNGSDFIVYENNMTREDMGRVPSDYDYSAHAILGIRPADENAIILELNQFRGGNTNMPMTPEEQKKLEDLQKAFDTMQLEMNQKDTTITNLTATVQTFESEKLKTELNQFLSNFNDDEKQVVQEKVKAFNANPTQDAIKEIKFEVNSHVAEQLIAERKKQNENKPEKIEGDIFENNSSNLGDFNIYQ